MGKSIISMDGSSNPTMSVSLVVAFRDHGYRYDASVGFKSNAGFVYDPARRLSTQRSVYTSGDSTGKERDTESGNDYFGARYYASNMGRFLSPDWSVTPDAVPFADLENPQSLNLYSYVQNNPLSHKDEDGHFMLPPCGCPDPPNYAEMQWQIENFFHRMSLGFQMYYQQYFGKKTPVVPPPVVTPAQTANPNPDDKQEPGKKKTSRNQLQKQVYNNNNQATSTNLAASVGYDQAGNITNDGVNSYAIDAESRVCSFHDSVLNENWTNVYDAGGHRVAKGQIPSGSSCYTGTGFVPTETDVLGQSGEQFSTLTSSGWQRTNVYANGQLLATYEGGGVYFALNDWLGSKRKLINGTGSTVENAMNLWFGDGTQFSGSPDASDHHFTGQLHDTQSGLDYFGARFYQSKMGRFLSPDWSVTPDAVPFADLENPQSLNLYSYVRNNPLSRIDADGHCWPEWLCNVVTEVKNEVFHGEFTTDTAGAKIRQIDRQEAKDRQNSLTLEQGQHPEPHEPNQSVTGATDAAGLLGMAAPKLTKRLHLGPLGAGVSILNDPSMKNIGVNLFGLTELGGAPMATTGALTDFMDWSVNNSSPGPQKVYGNDQLTPTLPVQDGGCEAAGLGPC
jgi:RHS repeat-associated protein